MMLGVIVAYGLGMALIGAALTYLFNEGWI